MITDFSQILTVQNILIYLVIINIIGFGIMYIDKQKAKHGKWRIKEITILVITLIGGGFGTIAGMYIFRHKTKKLKFTVGLPTILIFEIILVIYFVTKGILVI